MSSTTSDGETSEMKFAAGEEATHSSVAILGKVQIPEQGVQEETDTII